MLKIAHFIDSHDPGGAESIVVELCRRTREYGYTPEVYHFGNPWLEEKCRKHHIPAVPVPAYRLYTSALTIPLFTLLFVRFLTKHRVDILHSHLFGPITGACFATYLAGIPHIGTLHDIYTIDEKKTRVRYLRLASRLGTRLITVSHQMKTYLAELGRLRNGGFHTIVNGLDLDTYCLVTDRKQFPALGLDPEDIVFICVGRLEEIKGHDLLLKAFKTAAFKTRVKLLIVGEGPCRPKLQQQINEAGLRRKVKMLGQRDDVPLLLNLSDCFVLSSRSEGLSCSIIEAMAAGLPVIATDVGGNRELIVDGVNGYIVEPGNPDSLAVKMTEVLHDGRKRKEFGRASQAYAREQYSVSTMMTRYGEQYDELVTSQAGSFIGLLKKHLWADR